MSNEHALHDKHVAILATNGFEQSELFEPKAALLEAGATVDVVSLEKGSIKGWDVDTWGKSIDVDKLVSDVSELEYDALVIPSGLFSPDTLRANARAVDFVKSFFPTVQINRLPLFVMGHGYSLKPM